MEWDVYFNMEWKRFIVSICIAAPVIIGYMLFVCWTAIKEWWREKGKWSSIKSEIEDHEEYANSGNVTIIIKDDSKNRSDAYLNISDFKRGVHLFCFCHKGERHTYMLNSKVGYVMTKGDGTKRISSGKPNDK